MAYPDISLLLLLGRGLTEYFDVDPHDIDIMSISMAHALASVGGLCVGTTEVRGGRVIMVRPG